MAFTASVDVDRLPSASAYPTPPPSSSSLHRHTLLVPILDPHASVKSSLKRFIRDSLSIPDHLQRLSAPLFSLLADHEVVEDIYARYRCSADAESSELHVDEESFAFFARERGQDVELRDDDRLDQRHVVDSSKLHLKVLPQELPEQGGRIFVEMKNGVLPLQGISPRTSVSQIKRTIEKLTGIPMAQQLLSSTGRIMHDEFCVGDFDGLHSIFEDSMLDLCMSGDSNSEQSHRRVPVKICISDGVELVIVVQGRDTVRSIMQLVEARTGAPPSQQRISFSGKVLDERKTLSDCFIHPDCSLQVTILKKAAPRRRIADDENDDLLEQLEGGEESEERKPLARKIKLVRTLRGSVTGTVTIPVLTTDRIIELRKKIKRSLQPLVERNLSMMQTPQREPKHIDITPGACKLSPMNPSSSCTRPPLSFSSSSPGEKSKLNAAMRQKLVAAGGSFSSPSPPPLPPTPSSSSSASPLSASAARLHLEHPSSSALKTTSARRLEFEPAIGTPRMKESLSNGAAKNCNKLELEGGSMMMAHESCKAEMMMPKRSLGAWINSSVQALAGQIRGAQILHNQSTDMEGMN